LRSTKDNEDLKKKINVKEVYFKLQDATKDDQTS